MAVIASESMMKDLLRAAFISKDDVGIEMETEEAIKKFGVFTTGKVSDGIVSFVESREVIYMQPLIGERQLINQALMMNLYYSSEFEEVKHISKMPSSKPKNLSIEKVCLGTCNSNSGHAKTKIFCAAPDLLDEYFYRAELMERVSPSKVKVKYVDYGTCDEVPLSYLMDLPNSFRKLPPGCLKCRLATSFPKDIPIDFIREKIEGRRLAFRIDGVTEIDGITVVPFVIEGLEEIKCNQILLQDFSGCQESD